MGNTFRTESPSLDIKWKSWPRYIVKLGFKCFETSSDDNNIVGASTWLVRMWRHDWVQRRVLLLSQLWETIGWIHFDSVRRGTNTKSYPMHDVAARRGQSPCQVPLGVHCRFFLFLFCWRQWRLSLCPT